jgi:MFS family permease
MKIDLVGPERRGFAMGLNEFAGYLAMALSALGSGIIAERVGLRPEPFYLGIVFVAMGLGLSAAFVRETAGHVRHEAMLRRDREPATGAGSEPSPKRRELLARSLWRDRALFSACQAGLVNNLNDGLAWGLFPIFFAAAGLSLGRIALLTFVYPAISGIAQLGTGALSDRLGRKGLIACGMILQGVALAAMVIAGGFRWWVACGMALGIGTAMVYPTLLASIGDVAHPSWRGSAVGVYRLWRDLGYAVGALLAGVLADAFGMQWSIAVIGALTLASGVVVAVRMPETLRPIQRGSDSCMA